MPRPNRRTIEVPIYVHDAVQRRATQEGKTLARTAESILNDGLRPQPEAQLSAAQAHLMLAAEQLVAVQATLAVRQRARTDQVLCWLDDARRQLTFARREVAASRHIAAEEIHDGGHQ